MGWTMPDGTTDAAPEMIMRDGRVLVTRAASVAPASYDPETREFYFVATTEAPVRRRDWRTGRDFDEVLVMKRVKLDRFNDGAPILNSHRAYDLTDAVGSVVRGSGRTSGKDLICCAGLALLTCASALRAPALGSAGIKTNDAS